MILCPTCRRAWIPLGEVTRECPACRRKIGMCALVGGETRAEAERQQAQREASPRPLEALAAVKPQ